MTLTGAHVAETSGANVDATKLCQPLDLGEANERSISAHQVEVDDRSLGERRRELAGVVHGSQPASVTVLQR